MSHTIAIEYNRISNRIKGQRKLYMTASLAAKYSKHHKYWVKNKIHLNNRT